MCSFSTTKNNELGFRIVEFKDRELLFHWRNIPEIIALSADQKSVSWPEHVGWFENILTNESILILIITYKGKSIGQIRLKKENDQTANIGIYLIPTEVGKKRGSYLISESVFFAKEKWPNIRYIKAEVRMENKRSLKSFKSAGFKISHNGSVGNKYRIISMVLEIEL